MEGTSLKPSDATTGGVLNDADVTFKEVRAVLWDYAGKLPEATPALAVTMISTDGREVTQYYSAGDKKNFVPSKDGKRFIPVGTARSLSDSCNAIQFIRSIVDTKQFPEEKIEDDVTVFEGMVAHVIQVSQPKRAGLSQAEGKTILVVSKIIRLPWEKKTVAKAVPKPQAKSEPQSWEPKAFETVLAIVSERGGSVSKQDLPTLVFRKLMKDPDRNSIFNLVSKDDWLASGPWEFDGATITTGD